MPNSSGDQWIKNWDERFVRIGGIEVMTQPPVGVTLRQHLGDDIYLDSALQNAVYTFTTPAVAQLTNPTRNFRVTCAGVWPYLTVSGRGHRFMVIGTGGNVFDEGESGVGFSMDLGAFPDAQDGGPQDHPRLMFGDGGVGPGAVGGTSVNIYPRFWTSMGEIANASGFYITLEFTGTPERDAYFTLREFWGT